MFRNGYIVWCRSRTLCSHSRRKSTNVLRIPTSHGYFSFQYFALPQLHATRAVSGHSVPIIACMAAPAAAIIRFFGPESIGGVGDIGARIDAEAARSTGLSADEIGHKVHVSLFFLILLDRSSDPVLSKDIYPYRRKTCSNCWPSSDVWLRILPADGMTYLSQKEPHLKLNLYMFRFPLTDLSTSSSEEVTSKDNNIIFSLVSIYLFFQIFNSLFRECDAIVLTTSYAYESVSLDAMKQWLSNIQKEVHVLGPLLPAAFGTDNEEGANVDIETFLGEMLVQHGKRSVLLVKFLFLGFQLHNLLTFFSSGFLWHYQLAVSFGIRRRVDRCPGWKENTICTFDNLNCFFHLIPLIICL